MSKPFSSPAAGSTPTWQETSFTSGYFVIVISTVLSRI